MLFTRPDGDRIPDLSPMRIILPHLFPTANSAAVYFEQKLNLTHTLAWLKDHNAKGGPQLTFFHIVLAATVRVMVECPNVHRFIVGRKTWQRKKIELSFAVKKKFELNAALTAVKVGFDAKDSLLDVARKVDAAIGVGRGDALTVSEQEMKWTVWMPTWMLALLLKLQKVLDACNLLPASMLANDPMYASAFLANLGSIGIDAPYHHLYDYGTIPIFVAVGRITKVREFGEDGQMREHDGITMRYTVDERIADGLYWAKTLDVFRKGIEQPETM